MDGDEVSTETTDLEAGLVHGMTEPLFIPFRLDVYQADMEKRRFDIMQRGQMRFHDLVLSAQLIALCAQLVVLCLIC